MFKINPIFVIDFKSFNFVSMKSIVTLSKAEIKKAFLEIQKDGNQFDVLLNSLLKIDQVPEYVYIARITQAGSDAPIETERIVNTFPVEPEWSYKGVGEYNVELGVLAQFNNFINLCSDTGGANGLLGYVYGENTGGTQFVINVTDSSFLLSDNALTNFYIEIKAYK